MLFSLPFIFDFVFALPFRSTCELQRLVEPADRLLLRSELGQRLLAARWYGDVCGSQLEVVEELAGVFKILEAKKAFSLSCSSAFCLQKGREEKAHGSYFCSF